MRTSEHDAGRPFLATVLIVDDERSVTEGLAALLRKEPYEILCAQSAGEALAILRRRRVDVVLSDEHMPGSAGSELLAQVALQFPATARILLTGRVTLDVALRAINDAKICRLLRKPCAPHELTAALFEAVREALSAAASEQLLAVARIEVARHSGDLMVTGERSFAHRSPGFGALDGHALDSLSAREREVLALVLDGQRLAQVAKALFISPHTARNHLKSIFGKLSVHSQAELLARSRGLPLAR